jgi:hypothetical protein
VVPIVSSFFCSILDGGVAALAEYAKILGKTISHHYNVEKLGASGMGEFYKAADSQIGGGH